MWVYRLGGTKGHCKSRGLYFFYGQFCWRNLRERGYLKDLGMDGRIILR
jgi:hypothetical protein